MDHICGVQRTYVFLAEGEQLPETVVVHWRHPATAGARSGEVVEVDDDGVWTDARSIEVVAMIEGTTRSFGARESSRFRR